MTPVTQLAPISKGRLARIGVLGIGQSMAAVAQVYLLATIINRLSEGALESAVWLVALAGAMLADAELRRRERIAAEALGQDVVRSVRVGLFAHCLRLQEVGLGDLRRGGILLRFLGDLTPLRQWITLAYVRMPIALLTSVAAVIAVGAIDVALAAALMGPLAVGAGIGFLMTRPLYAELAKRRRLRNRLSANVAEKLAALESIRAAAREDRELRRLSQESERLRQASMLVARRQQNLRAALQVALGTSGVLVLMIGGSRLGAGDLTLGALVAALSVLGAIAPALTDLARLLELRPGVRLTNERLAVLLKLPVVEEDMNPRGSLPDGAPVLCVRGGRHGAATLTLRAGELVTLRGGTDTQRSAWLAAIAGVRGPPQGEIEVFGRTAGRLPPSERRRWLGYATPELPLVRGSVSKNIRYRNRGAGAKALIDALAPCGVDVSGPDASSLLERRCDANGRGLELGLRGAIRLARATLGTPRLVVIDRLSQLLPSVHHRLFLEDLRRRGIAAIVSDPDPRTLRLFDASWDAGQMTLEAGEPASRAVEQPSPSDRERAFGAAQAEADS